MSKDKYKNPKKKDLKAGKILDIYGNSKSQEEWLGKAVLIEYQPSKHGNENTYIRKEVGGTKSRQPRIIIWSTQRWLVEFIEGPLTGHRTCRYIAYYVGTGIECLKQFRG